MLEIGIVIYPGVQQAAVLGLNDLFCVANTFSQKYQSNKDRLIRVSHWQQGSLLEDPIRIFDTVPDASPAPLSALIVPPSLREPAEVDATPQLTQWLTGLRAQGVVLGSVCAGAFVLASTGLMNGRKMTTHWAYADLLRQRFPEIQVDVNQLIIDDGDIITAGGLMSWTDLGLRLVHRLLGPTVMIDTARMLLVDPPGREQRYYSVFSPRLTHGDAFVLKVQHWLQATQAKDFTLSALAAHSGLEERTFLRRFQKATGMTPTAYCQHLRVGRAQELLQFSHASFDRIAWEVGYSDPGALRKIFTRIVGLTPGEYRRRFSASHATENA
ncbi:GlxA family transcriptional regulator [Atlantibacter sp.]|uniref:GlxA family transcriptional regulator n=1 Tax=Atlantibacter sp. TaxID=1903473 RepID=UPI0028A6BDBF|nr:GlxA family transcriptional regulator [Atlantibacter sp.]